MVFSWGFPWIWTLFVGVEIHTFIFYPFRLHGILGQQVQGMNNIDSRNSYLAENAKKQPWHKMQGIRFGKKRRGSDIAENAEDRYCKKRRQTLPLFNAEDQALQKTQAAMAIRKTQRREKTRNIKI